MTQERWLILTFSVISATAAAGAAYANVSQFGPYVPFILALIAAGSAVGNGLVRGWFDSGPVQPH